MSEEAPLPKPEDYVGRTLDGRYRLDAVLGQGGMGMVFKATQTSMDRPVAVKTLHPQLAMAATFFERFKREAELASRLHHPNIITLYDFGRAPDGTCYFVMELLEGESLRQLVKREGPMTLRRAAAVLEQACLGVAHAHKQGVVHRDLKPHNIMLSRVDQHEFVKVLDFGLVKALEGEEEEQLTSTGQVLGTPQYMPPEQAGGENVDPRSDLYSLSGVFYYTLTGSSPFGAKTVRKALQAALTQPAPTVGVARVGAPVPPAIDALIKKGLSVEKKDRFESAEAMIAELHQALDGVSDADLDAVPKKGAGAAGSRESGSGSNSGAGKKGSKASSSASSRRQASPGPLPKPASDTLSLPFDKKVTSPEMPSVVEPAPGGMPGWVKVLAVAVPVMLLAAGGTLVVLQQREKPAPVQPPVATTHPASSHPLPGGEGTAPAVPTLLSVTLKSTPPGATVLEDGVLVGTTPLERKWPKETTKRVTFQLTGYQDLERSFRLEKDEAFDVELVAVKRQIPTPPDKPKKKAGTGDGIEAFE